MEQDNKSNNMDTLLESIAHGDETAFNLLFVLYYPKVKSFALRITNDEFTAEDIAQDIFMQLWINREKLSSIANLQSYLFIIARNLSLKALRKMIRKESIEGRDFLSSASSNNLVDTEELLDNIKRVLTEMTPQQRRIFMLSREEGMSNKQIAVYLGIGIRTVENHIAAAIRKLRDAEIIIVFLALVDILH